MPPEAGSPAAHPEQGPPRRERPDNRERAVLFMLIAALLLPAINACAKFLSDFSVFQITWARYAGHFAFMLILFAPGNGLAMLRSSRPSIQLTRSALHCASAFLTFTAVTIVPLATATAINFSAPLMVTALAPLLLGERIGLPRALAVAVGFAGAMIVVRPGLGGESFAVGLLLCSAVASANIQILSRKVAAYDRALTSNTYMVLVGFVLMTIPLPFVWRTPATALDISVFIIIGVLGGIGHYFLVRAFEMAPAAFLSPFNYAQIIGATALGYLLFGQLPDLWTWVGAAIIALSGMFLLVNERRGPKRDAKT